MSYRFIAAAAALAGSLLAPGGYARPPQPLPSPNQKADPQMQAVLQELAWLTPTPLHKLSVSQARRQPGPADAVKAVLSKQGKAFAPLPVDSIVGMNIPGPAGDIPVRVYKPAGSGPKPVLVYFHGGGWVLSDIDSYDASCRALVNAANCVVISVGYRRAPEYKFPAAHEDSYAATQYIIQNANKFGGDPARVAVGGESAGGNLAAAVCLMARQRGGKMPVHQLAIYPIADYGQNTTSYVENEDAIPLSRPAMAWFFKHVLSDPADGMKALISLDKAELRGLPPATVITAQIDPLRTEGKQYADRLADAEVPVRYRNYQGVAHEFFGMGAVVDKAKEAVAFAADGLKLAFGQQKTARR
ncbi:MAG: alpha/beta hydrolase [Armatimonas sp.]